MGLLVGSSDVQDVKVGSTDVNEIYVGSNLVWERVTTIYSEGTTFTQFNNDGWTTGSGGTLSTPTTTYRNLTSSTSTGYAELAIAGTYTVGQTIKYTLDYENTGENGYYMYIYDGASAKASTSFIAADTDNTLEHTVSGSSITDLRIRVRNPNSLGDTVRWRAITVTVE